jgi:two-component system cell cycle response regulator
MSSISAFVPQTPVNSGWTVLLASPDSQLSLDLQRIFHSMGLHVETATDSEAAVTAIQTLADSAVILLDVLLIGVANGRLLAAVQESGVHQRCPIALVAESISDEWVARLREGMIDDIVPRSADAAAWGTHLSTMRRGHKLLRELEQLRDASLHEAQHDKVTGAFNRGTMLTMLFRETDRVQRLRGLLSLMLFAIDDLAYWTDRLGRDACDRMLREVAQRAKRILRSYDLLGRTGHDEFLLALPGCSAINAAMMADRMRMDVFGEPFMVQNERKETIPVRLTACFAVTSSRGRSPVVVMREAAQTLAVSRQSGPDSIRCASESPLPAELSSDLASLFSNEELIA